MTLLHWHFNEKNSINQFSKSGEVMGCDYSLLDALQELSLNQPVRLETDLDV